MTHHHEHATDPRRIRAVGDILARGIRRLEDMRHRRIVAESAATSLDLVAEPSVTVQVKTDRFPATARVAEGSERERLWQLMCDLWPAYDTYQSRTERVIPVIILERSNHE